MNEEEKRKAIARIRRMAGQVRSLEELLLTESNVNFVIQLEAVIAAAKGLLTYFTVEDLKKKEKLSETDIKILTRLIKKF